MDDGPKAEVKTETPAVAAAAETAPAAETAVKSEPSPLAVADAAKHEGAPKEEAKPEAKAEAKPEIKAETKAEAKPDVKPETKESGAESAETKPPETKAEIKPEGEKKPEGEAKPEVKADTKEAPAETPQAPPVYDNLKLPEGIKLDDNRVKKFDEVFGKTELATKADHAAMTALRQDLINMHVEEVQSIVKQVQKHQVDVWNKLVEGRVADLKADPTLGGNRIETTLGNAKYALESMIPGFSKDEAKELIAVMDAGGVSHHKLMIKVLNGIYELLREPEPIPGQLPLKASTSKEAGQRGWYESVEGQKAAS